ncbi:FAD binding domain-containing protein [Streptomyces justiciae]|uniref:FAD binding domain-containing protein n=1 Tax=Streptomyces justiciae TaxID=2780140 RepID=UPI0021198C5E|nr:FAD binding domain-containing protein [Streptomyces justiciae]MCW8381340.1 FAD binding domain-containing protein [Streptomyces justiciae]
MLLRLPTSVSEARQCLSEGAIPVGGATLQWAVWQRDGFPQQAMSLREVPEANVLGAGELGAAVLLHRVDERVPEVLHQAASRVGTGAVRRTATVGGNIVGSTLRCLLPAALVLNARATALDTAGTFETDLTELTAKRPLLLSLRWRTPLASTYRKLPETGEPPLVIAAAVTPAGESRPLLRVAVRDGYDVLTETVPYNTDPDRVLDALAGTPLGALPAPAREAVRVQVAEVLGRTAV